MNMKYNYRILLIILILSVLSHQQSTHLDISSLRPGELSSYSILINQEYHHQITKYQNMNVSIVIPTGYELNTVRCECQIHQNRIIFTKYNNQTTDFNWTIKNPVQEGKYAFNITIQSPSNDKIIEIKNVGISHKLKIGQTNGINVAIVPQSFIVAAITNYTFTISLSTGESISLEAPFLISFPKWSPLIVDNPTMNSQSFKCMVGNDTVGCTVSSENQRQIVVLNSSVFNTSLNAGHSLIVKLLNVTNPSSTQPNIIAMKVGETYINQTITMITPATANSLVLSSISNLTGVQFNTTVRFNGNLYYIQFFRIIISNNINQIRYNNQVKANNFTVSDSSQSAQFSQNYQFPSYFTLTTPLSQSSFTINITSFFVDSGQQYQIQTIIGTYFVYPNVISIARSNIFLFTTSNLTFNVTLPFQVNSITKLRLTFQQNSNKLNCTSCATFNIKEIDISPNQTYLSTNIQFQFIYFTSATLIAQLFLSNGSLSSTTQTISMESFCGSTCKNCSVSNPTICTQCFSIQQSGTQFYYYQNQNKCYQTCPTATYANSQLNICVGCPLGCSVCDNSNTCITCSSNYTRHTNGTCISICGLTRYMNSQGVCESCSPDCTRCMNYSYCLECNNQTQLSSSNICRQDCLGDCRTCDQTKLKCTSCLVGYLYEYQCYTVCPAGTVTVGNRCQYASNNITFPFLISFVVLCVALGSTKFFFRQTDIFGLMMVALGICEVASAVATTILLMYDFNVFSRQLTIIGVGLISYVLTNITFLIIYIIKLRKDVRLKDWMSELKNKITLYIVLVLSSLYSFKIFRLIYSKFFSVKSFSSKFLEIYPVIPLTNIITGINYLTFSLLSIAGGVMALALSPISYRNSQGYFFCIELIIIEIIGLILFILDFKKSDDYFQVEVKKQSIVDQNKQGTLQNIQTDYDNSKIQIKTKSKSKSPKKDKDKSPTIKKKIPTDTMKGFNQNDKSALGVQRKSLQTDKQSKNRKNKDGKTSEQQIIGKEGRRGGNRFNRKKRNYDTGSNESFDIYLDFDHEPKPKSKDTRSFKTPKNINYRSSELKPQSKPKITPMNDIYVGFLNSESDFNLNSSIDVPKKKQQQRDSINKPRVIESQMKIIQNQEQPQIIINLDEPAINLPKRQNQTQNINNNNQNKNRSQNISKNQSVKDKGQNQNQANNNQQSYLSPIKHLNQQKQKQKQIQKIQKKQDQQNEIPIVYSKTQGFQH